MFRVCSSIFQKTFFTDVTPLIRLGRAKPLQVEDLPSLPTKLEPQALPHRLVSIPLCGPWRFLQRVVYACGREMAVVTLLVAAAIATGLLIPLAMRTLIGELNASFAATGSLSTALLLTFGFSALIVANTVLIQHYYYGIQCMAQLIVSGLNMRIYAHALTLSRQARQDKPIGDVINHMGTDTGSVSETPIVVAEVIYGLGVIVSVAVMAVQLIGLSALVALGLLIVLSPLCRLIAKRFIACDDAIMQRRDERVNLMSQVISGIRVIKYLAWEQRIESEIGKIREAELAARKRLAFASGCSLLLFLSTQAGATVAALSSYILLGHKLDAGTAFAVIALFDLWQHPFYNLTNYIADLAAAKVGAERIIAFLRQESLPVETALVDDETAPGLCLSDFSAGGPAGKPALLRGWNLSLAGGSATAVVGPVGSGKTSLLLSLLGELDVRAGSRQWVGLDEGTKPRIAFVPQTPYIVNATVRRNIQLGLLENTESTAPTRHDSALLARAIRLSALAQDVAAMPAGVETEIGEQGINLSGGQKQRVSLARAYLRRPTLLLLDDPFAAVDSNTERLLADELLFGEWKDVTRLVATHRLEHLERFDTIVYVEHGEIKATGTLADLLRWSPDFRDFYAEHRAADTRAKATHLAVSLHTPNVAVTSTPEESKPELMPVGTEDAILGKRFTVQEDRENGQVRLRVYVDYMRALGGKGDGAMARTTLILLALALATGLASFLPLLQTYWLSVWTGASKSSGGLSAFGALVARWRGNDPHNLFIYALIAALAVACAFGRYVFWNYRAIVAGQQLHDQALHHTLGTTIRFFDTNPVGRILNRFSFDTDSVERQMASSVEQMVFSLCKAALTIGIIVVLSPWTLLVLAPALFAFYHLQDTYRRSARETKRLNSVTRSPRFAHFKETLEGLETIRAHGYGEFYWQRFYSTLDANQRSFRAMVITNRWFSVRLPLLTGVVSAISVGAAMMAAKHGVIDAAGAALLLFYNFMFTDHLNHCVRSFSEAEARLTSVERLQAYGRLAPELDISKEPAADLDAESACWPTGGALEFVDVRARFAKDLPDVLRGVSFRIPAGAKVGVIGRTGAGKTSLIQTLYRFIELESGTILIDGVDIARVPKRRLRSAMAIIPQSPTLFLGALRDNLDRFGVYSDDQIWQALRDVQLGEFIATLPDGLRTPVREGGANFSDGQRQLLCLARALLSDAKLIIMDEATASVDVVTDQMIHRSIERAFHDRTILIIAHRLGTVSHCDMIIEMDQGRVASIRRPGVLTCPERLDLRTLLTPAPAAVRRHEVTV